MARTVATLVGFLLLTLPAAAQITADVTAEVIPPNPTSADFVVIRIKAPPIINDYDVTRTGNHLSLSIGTCHMTCVSTGTADVRLGLLAAGNYTYDVFIDEFDGEDPSSLSGSFVVTQEAVAGAPTLSPATLLALSAILGAIGWTVLQRQA